MQSLSLGRITSSFSAPITEEHAFAVVHECLRTLKEASNKRIDAAAEASPSPSRLLTVDSTGDIFIHREGRVHEKTFLQLQQQEEERDEAGERCYFI